jgi:uncharacterized membrane protein YfhO
MQSGKISSKLKFNKFYLLAFFIPAAIILIAYFLFGIEPFGDESVLALDLNGQYVYYFENLRDAFWGDGSFINSWSRNLSGEFVGIFAYYLASPFTLIVILFPRAYITEALLVMQLVKVGCASLAFCFYLFKCRKVNPSTGLIFGIMYGCCAYMIVQLMNPMWIDGLIFLPLICLAIEKLVETGRFAFFSLILALMFIANFYIGWMVAIFVCFYFLAYYFFISEKTHEGKPIYKSPFYLFSTGVKFAAGGILAAGIAAWLLLPLYSSLSLGKFEFTNPDYTPKAYFDMLLFFKNMLPNVYDTCRPEGSPVVYCGVGALILLPLYFMNDRISFRKKMGFGLLALFILISMYVSTLDLVWHGFQLPNWLPYRYSFIFSFLCLIMAADSLKNAVGINRGRVGAALFAVIIFVLWINMQEIEDVPFLAAIWFTIAFAAVYALVVYLIVKGRHIKQLTTALVCITAVEFIVSTTYNIYQINADIVYSNRSSYNRYITLGRDTVEKIHEIDPSPVYRIEKNFKRTVNDNMAFGSFGISHSSSTLNAGPLEFLRNIGFGYGGHYVEYNGETYISDALLGIKYVMEKGTPETYIKDDQGIITGKEAPSFTLSKHYDEIVLMNADNTEMFVVYENPYALPIAYMSDSAIRSVELKTANPFDNQNQILSKLLGTNSMSYFKRIYIDNTIPENVIEGTYGAHEKWTVQSHGQNAQIAYEFTAPTDDLVYAFFPAVYERKVNMWLDKEFVNYYFEGGKMSIQTLGRFEPGSEHILSLTIDNEKDETLYTDKQIYYLDMDMFEEAIGQLRKGGLNVTEFSEDHIVGTVDSQINGILFTTIAYEPGWTCYVDGEKAEIIPLLDNSVIGVPMDIGHHTVEFKFFPQYMGIGILISIVSLLIIASVFFFELKDAKKQAEARQFRANQLDLFTILEAIETDDEADYPAEPSPAVITESETESEVEPEAEPEANTEQEPAADIENSEDKENE